MGLEQIHVYKRVSKVDIYSYLIQKPLIAPPPCLIASANIILQ